jgi:hypothetical protein
VAELAAAAWQHIQEAGSLVGPDGRGRVADSYQPVIDGQEVQLRKRLIDVHNDDPKPFVWTATADEIIEKVQRGRVALKAVKQN